MDMINKKIEKLKEESRASYDLAVANKLAMEQTVEVKNYLKEIEKITEQLQYQEFLENLEIGEDGTLFAPSSSKKKYYEGTLVLKYALILKCKGEFLKLPDCPLTSVTINRKCSLKCCDFLRYLRNAESVLTEMKRYRGDKVVSEKNGIEIIQNPKNIAIDLESEEKNLLCALEKYGKDAEFRISNDDIENFRSFDIYSLSKREQSAFFGKRAQNILEVSLENHKIVSTFDEGTIKKSPYKK